MSRISALVQRRAQGMSLPGEFYLDEEVFREDLRRVFGESWLLAGHACEIPSPGDYFSLMVGEEPLVVVRGNDGETRAFYDVCRHRGSRITTCERGSSKALICPYHQWVYALDGSLTNARLMGTDFDRSRYRLGEAALREVAGLIFVCLSENPPDFAPAYEAMEPQLRPHGLENARVIRRHRYDVEANWKVIVENNRECYHCQVSHPEFCASNYDLGLPGDTRADTGYEAELESAYARWRELGLSPKEISFPNGEWFRIARLPLKEGYLTETMDGRPSAPLMGDLMGHETGSLRVVGLPNFWAHANCDYAMTTRLLPLGAERTRVDVSFLVREDAEEGVDCDPERLTAVWKATSEEDWELCENNHAGIRSRAYRPGPYSPLTESSVEQFIGWYLDLLRAGEEQETAARAG